MNLRDDLPDVWLVSYTPNHLYNSRASLIESARRSRQFKGSFEWDFDSLARCSVLRDHPQLLVENELELWKPAVILEQLKAIPPGDLILYHDVGKGYWGDYTFDCSIKPLLDWATRCNNGLLPGIWVPEEGPNSRWTTCACFETMGCVGDIFRLHPQLQTTYSLWRRDDHGLGLAGRWLEACARVYQGAVGATPNFAEFRRDRGSRSVLTNLTIAEGVTSFGKFYESTIERIHPGFAPIPATDIGILISRIRREAEFPLNEVQSASRPEDPVDPRPSRIDTAKQSGSRALFTSIPPRLDRVSPQGIPVGGVYQEECIASWRRCGFQVYSIHFSDELADLVPWQGVTYLGVERTEDDSPADRKPSLRAILSKIDAIGADLSGIVNSDIFLLNTTNWVEQVERESTDSIVVFTRYETNEIARTIIGAAPWGFDLFLFDRRFIKNLRYCGMRIGEAWWDFWLPLWFYFSGANIKHVEECIALHLYHPLVSNKNVLGYGKRFLETLSESAASDSEQKTRLTEFYEYCLYRFAIECEERQIADRNSLAFVLHVQNPTVWAGIVRLLRQYPLDLVPKIGAHDAFLSRALLRTSRYVDALRTRMAYRELSRAGGTLIPTPAPSSLAEEVSSLMTTWPYRIDLRTINALRSLIGRSPKAPVSPTNDWDAAELVHRLERHPVWRFLSLLRPEVKSLRRIAGSRRAELWQQARLVSMAGTRVLEPPEEPWF